MACEHKRIKSVNCVLFCADCGAKLPAGWTPGETPVEEPEAVKTPAETPETVDTPAEGQKRTRRKTVK